MRVTLLWVGRSRIAEIDTLCRDYASRIERLGVPVTRRWVRETPAGKRFSDDHVMEREGRTLLEKAPGQGTRIAVDRRGRELDSVELARRLERWATPEACFLIGGPLGLPRSLVEQVEESWSLSRMTYPHEIARLLVLEQVYRALTIARGIPYHK
jgi:23S rRNA (pseudouridine1915-N3)-methyltransferase